MSILETISRIKENSKILIATGILALLLVIASVWYFMFYQPSTIIYEDGNTEQTSMDYTQGDFQGQDNLQNLPNETDQNEFNQGELTQNDLNGNEAMEQNISPYNENNQEQPMMQNNIDINPNVADNINAQSNIDSKDIEYNAQINTYNNLNTKDNVITQLTYSIKPLDTNVASCSSMSNGKWNMIKSCENNMLSSIHQLINTNKEIVALEVSGVVDSNPYAGPSAELKQEGLASFRAREAIKAITSEFSNIAVFEGLSMQIPNKRGFEVKAYYLQK